MLLTAKATFGNYMLNHSFEPNCFFHWCFKDRMLEVLINAGQCIRKGDEMTVSYMSSQKNDMFMQRYGFSSPVIYGIFKCSSQSCLKLRNPWDKIKFSDCLSNTRDTFVDGAVLATARTLPTWLDGDVPPIPSTERKAAKDLQDE